MQFDTALLFYEQVLIYLWQNEMVDAYDTPSLGEITRISLNPLIAILKTDFFQPLPPLISVSWSSALKHTW